MGTRAVRAAVAALCFVLLVIAHYAVVHGVPSGDELAAGGYPSVWPIALADLGVLLALRLLAERRLRGVRRHLDRIGRTARQLGGGDLTARVPQSADGPADVRRLAATFNDMAESVRVLCERRAAFMADASHQLRNPLTALSLRMEMLSLSVDGQRRAEVELIREEMHRLEAVLGRLLDLAAGSALAVRTGPVFAPGLVLDRVSAWQPQAQRRSISLSVVGECPVVIGVDATLASSILDSLLDNAIKFTPEGGRVTVRLRDDGPMAVIEVVDEGPGLQPGDLESIGDRFQRGSTASEAPGTGLGLFIAREMAAVIGAQLTFAAAKPHGLCVGLRVPRAPARASTSAQAG